MAVRWIIAVALTALAIVGADQVVRAQSGLQTMAQALAQAPPVPTVSFATSGDAAFDAWRDDFARRAIAQGRRPSVVSQVLAPLVPEQRVVEADRNQPEFVRPVWDYITRAVSADRVSGAQRLAAENAALLSDVEARLGVDRHVLLGIWGIETNFGAAKLPHDAAQAIATLAFEGRRRAQFEGYLLALIEMVERGYAAPGELKSSWAGALGQPQFMPDVYLRDAMDWDGDGRRDIWANRGDTLASIANYLAKRGWRVGEPVFEEARLPESFDYALADGANRAITDWEALGVRGIDGQRFAGASGLTAQLFLPAGKDGPALMLFNNFRVLRSYNPSDRYALAVALIARGAGGRGGIVARWPVEQGVLGRGDIVELQTLLAAKGYAAGAADGMMGSNTRAAVRAYQRAEGLPADGWPTRQLLDRLRGAPGAAATAQPIAVEIGPDQRRSEARDLTGAEIRTLQGALNTLGYSIGRPSGQVGPRTRKAIGQLEDRLGLARTGRADAYLLSEARRLVRSRSNRQG